MKFVRELSARSQLMTSDSGRLVVLKRLGEDCLLEGGLHPSIHQRLERIRELPHKQVANLHGVERREDGGQSYLVWDYIEGSSIAGVRTRDNIHRLARDLKLAVQGMHALGIVHGAIHEGNVIVDRQGKLWLIDVSPLLWTDESNDNSAVDELLIRLGMERDDLPAHDSEEIGQEISIRRRSLLWAAIALLAGVSVAIAAVAWLK